VIKKLLVVLIVVLAFTLSGCGEPKAGESCSIPGKVSEDANGFKLMCSRNASDEWVWLIVGKG
jgi:hypothetical protein